MNFTIPLRTVPVRSAYVSDQASSRRRRTRPATTSIVQRSAVGIGCRVV
ncbi:MAG TPA: hypothetical protein VGD01_09255 [Candidatus Elarobacter sp.]